MHRVVFDEAAKGIMGQQMDMDRVNRALDTHVKEMIRSAPGLKWAMIAVGSGFSRSAGYTSGSVGKHPGYEPVLNAFPPWVRDAVRWWDSLWGGDDDSGRSAQPKQRWAQHSTFRAPMHEPPTQGPCIRCRRDWRTWLPSCPDGPCEVCRQVFVAHNQQTRACPAEFTPAQLR